MQNEFSFTDAHHEDSPIIDVTIDGDHYTKHMPSHFSTGIIYFAFYEDKECKHPVTPTGGTITCTGTALGEVYLEPSKGTGIINASDVGYIFGNYTPPMFLGKMSVFRIVTKDIKGANYLRAIAWRS